MPLLNLHPSILEVYLFASSCCVEAYSVAQARVHRKARPRPGFSVLVPLPRRRFRRLRGMCRLLSFCEDTRVIHSGLTWDGRRFTMRQPRSGRASARLDSGCSLTRLNLQAA